MLRYLSILLLCLAFTHTRAQVKIIYTLDDCKTLYEIQSLYSTGKVAECAGKITTLLNSESVLKKNRELRLKLYECYKGLNKQDSAGKYLLQALRMGAYCMDSCNYADYKWLGDTVHSEVVRMYEINNKQYTPRKEWIDSLKQLVIKDRRYQHDKKYADSMKTAGLADEWRAQMRTHNMIVESTINYILETYGWPGYKILGKEGDKFLHILVQDMYDIKFQKKVLWLMSSVVLAGNTNPANYAYLHDRISTRDNKRQVFGTQIQVYTDPATKKTKREIYPIADNANINYYRLAFGLDKFTGN